MRIDKQYLEIKDVCKMFGTEQPPYIITNPDLKRRKDRPNVYEIILTCKHDGSLIYTQKLLYDLVKRLVCKQACDTRLDQTGLKDIYYEVGIITLASVYGRYDLPLGNYRGVRQRARIPVRCHIIK